MSLMNLNKKLDRMDYRGRSKAGYMAKPKKRSFKKFFVRFLIVLVLLFVLIYLPARGVYQSGRNIVHSARALSTAAQNQNLDQIRSNLADMKKSTGSLNLSLNFLIWLRVIPFVGGYYADARHFSKAADYELTAMVKLADSLDPYKAELGFTGQPTPGSDRIAQLVKVLDKVNPQLPSVEPDLKKAADEVSSVDVEKYPENFGKYRLRSQIDTAKNFIIGADTAVSKSREALLQAPGALGAQTPKNYLIIFQNDKELRATGGFMTAYAFLKLDKGRVSSSTSDDIYRLDEKLLDVCRNKVCPLTPPAPISKYLPEANGKPRTAWSMRDSNLSPDVPTSMKQFESMYSLLGNGLPFDGIILIDTHVVEDLIKITGPIEVFGTRYSADTDPRCNCPNVIYELESYAQIIEKGENDRKAILGTLMQQLLARSLSTGTDKMPEFINTSVELANSKHIMFFMHDQSLQKSLAQLNWAGEVYPSTGDYLMVNDSNFAGGKSNLYVTEDVLLEVNKSNGKQTNKLTINYKNPQIYNRWLNGINRDYVRVYVPMGSKLITSKGSEAVVATKDELGKTYFDAFIQVRPQNSNKLTFEYEVPSSSGSDYNLLIQKQPGTKDFSYELKLNGSSKDRFNLSGDKQFKL